MSDISYSKKHYELEKLIKKSAKYRQLSDAAFEAIFLSEKGICTGQNKAAEEMFGYTGKEAVGLYETDLIHPDYRDKVMHFMLSAYKKPYEAVALRKDGSTFPCKIQGKMTTEKNRTIRITALRDITERKKLEEQLRELNENKDIFFSIISHDLRAPYNIFLGFSDLIIEHCKKREFEKIEEFASIINKTANQSFKLLNDLLEWSKSQRGKLELDPVNFNIHETLSKVVESYLSKAKQKNITITLHADPKIEITSDKNIFETITRNLLLNAVKFTETGGKIIVKIRKNKNEIEFSVNDTGIGIKKEDLDKLFRIDSYFSTPGTNNEKGSGLGLILCKEFIEKLGGKIWAVSEYGKGSSFYFTIPYHNN